MSASDKAKLRELGETSERNETAIRAVQTMVRGLHLDEVKQQLSILSKAVPERAKQSSFDTLQILTSQELKKVKEHMSEISDRAQQEVQSSQSKMLRILEQDALRADAIQKCLDAVTRTE